MRVTIADVAREAGVSKTTVSRVVNAKGEVGGSTAARVREVIAQLGYVPSSGAVGLARGSSRTVGKLVPSLTWPWMGEVLQGVVDTVEAADYGLLLFTCNRGAESVERFTSQVSARAFDGLVVVEPENTLDHLTALHRGGLPIVLIDDRGHHPEFASVVTTNHEGGASAARHLLAAGRTRPLVLTGPQHFGCVRDRLDGFRTVLPTDLVVHGDFTEQSGRQAVEQLLSAGTQFDSVFAHNDISAAGVLRALRAAGRSVPDDIAVVGFDDAAFAAYADPPLTTVRQPVELMGQEMVRLLLARIADPWTDPAEVILPTALVTRASA
jgi:LacI family transcriptional regulator